jgi:DNA replication protein DnaC
MREQTFERLYSLKLHGMAQALEEQLKDAAAASLGFEERLARLVDSQWLWRENRAMATRLRKARLKVPASMEEINYRHQRQLDRSLMRSLASCDWVKQHHNVTISGASGIGKTYLCCALLEQACRKGYTAYYASAPKFFRQLAIGYADGSFDRILSKLARIDVLGIDSCEDPGYVQSISKRRTPADLDGGQLHITRGGRQRLSSHLRMEAFVRHSARPTSILPRGRALTRAARFVSRSTAA